MPYPPWPWKLSAHAPQGGVLFARCVPASTDVGRAACLRSEQKLYLLRLGDARAMQGKARATLHRTTLAVQWELRAAPERFDAAAVAARYPRSACLALP